MGLQLNGGLLSPFLMECRFKAILPHVNGVVLDFGCGSGHLCEHIAKDKYLGVDRDDYSIRYCKQYFSEFKFQKQIRKNQKFDTIVALAVVEHVADPGNLIKKLAGHLSDDGRLILTTPSPFFKHLYTLGVFLGLFSQEAHDEHDELLGRLDIESMLKKTNLTLIHYKKFLFGANQLFVIERE